MKDRTLSRQAPILALRVAREHGRVWWPLGGDHKLERVMVEGRYGKPLSVGYQVLHLVLETRV